MTGARRASRSRTSLYLPCAPWLYLVAMKVRVVTESDLAFDSAKDLAEQPTDAEADDWERRLNSRD